MSEADVKKLDHEKGRAEAEVELRAIGANDVKAFRLRVLRPPKREHAAYPGDDAADTLHLGAFVDAALVAVATVCREAMPGTSDADAWRLRGMATLDEFRGRGVGKRMVEACVTHAISQGAESVWCSARISVLRFYQAAGFKEQGEPFSLPEYSEHSYVLMKRELRGN